MKNITRRNLLLITFLAIISIFCINSPFQLLDLGSSSEVSSNVMIKKSNVNYPTILADQKAQSINYVEKYSLRNHNVLVDLFNKGKDFFPKIASVFTSYGVPTEMKVLIAIESGFKANAVSKAGAVGYWQMMDEMAVGYGLNINKKSKTGDERKNFDKSTTAAARYLRDACNEFDNNVLLAVAAYNCGSGNVRKAIKKSGVDSETASFWDIKQNLPKETQYYVMNFIALNVIFDNYDKFSNNQLVFQPQQIAYVQKQSNPVL